VQEQAKYYFAFLAAEAALGVAWWQNPLKNIRLALFIVIVACGFFCL